MDMELIGNRICKLRKGRNMTQVELADLMGVSYQAVSSWERGLTMPDVSKLPSITQHLETTIDELINNQEEHTLIKKLIDVSETEDLEQEVSVEVIERLAPILTPHQVDALLTQVEVKHMNQLLAIAPFAGSDALDKLANGLGEAGDADNLVEIAPFLSKETVDYLALSASRRGEILTLERLAPFMSQAILGEIAIEALGQGRADNLVELVPFLSREVVDQLAIAASSRGEDEVLECLAPFMTQNGIERIMLQAVTISG